MFQWIALAFAMAEVITMAYYWIKKREPAPILVICGFSTLVLIFVMFHFEYYPPWEPPVSRFRATRKWYFPPSEPPQHIVAAHIFDFTINLLIVILGELLMQYHQIIYREVFLCLRRQKSEVFWNFWEKI